MTRFVMTLMHSTLAASVLMTGLGGDARAEDRDQRLKRPAVQHQHMTTVKQRDLVAKKRGGRQRTGVLKMKPRQAKPKGVVFGRSAGAPDIGNFDYAVRYAKPTHCTYQGNAPKQVRFHVKNYGPETPQGNVSVVVQFYQANGFGGISFADTVPPLLPGQEVLIDFPVPDGTAAYFEDGIYWKFQMATNLGVGAAAQMQHFDEDNLGNNSAQGACYLMEP